MNQASPADFGLPLPGLAGSVLFSLPLFLFLRLVGSSSSSSKRMCLPFRFNLNDRLGGPAGVKAYVRRNLHLQELVKMYEYVMQSSLQVRTWI